jgi:SAM-dependent methyltransferase
MLKAKIRDLLVWNRYYDYCEFRIKTFVKRLSRETIAGRRMLDVGAGQCQYKPYFTHLDYVAQDSGVGDETWDFSQIDIKSEIYDIPVEANSFDYILCTQVMEHLQYPHKAFTEFARILKPGGLLFVTCPFVWKEHQKPHDFFRYTQFSLKFLAEENNFEVVELNKEGGKYITIARMFIDINLTTQIHNQYLRYLIMALFYPFKFLIGFVAYYLDKLDRVKDLTIQYEGIFRKI